jgi:tRNA (guanine-N7-)-methyltransferase
MTTAHDDPRPERRIRSFVLRQGRITPAQQRAFDEHWARFGLEYSGAARDLDAAFGRAAPKIVEIGFGNGEQLVHAAQSDPARDYLGIEVHRPGVGRLLNAVAEAGLGNVRVYRHDAVEVLEREIAPGTLAQVRIYFPDPWHKKRHHKRRLVQPALVELVASRLAPGGQLHLATDWLPYAEQMLEVCRACAGLRNTSPGGDWVERPAWRSETHFERRGLKLGHGVRDLLFERR